MNNMYNYNYGRSHQRETSEVKQVPAMAYVPDARWEDVFDAQKGLSCGTIFPELYLPFLGGKGARDER